MSFNNVAETSTSTGTGNFTLAGAWSQSGTYNTGNLTFASRAAVNQVVPYMIRDTSGNWEKGQGYLSDSTTFVRLNVFDNSLGTKAKISFSAGTKIVFIPTDAKAFGSSMQNIVNWSLTPQSVGIRGELTLAANRMYLTPHLIAAPIKLSAVAFTVTLAAATSTMRVGLYNLTKQSDTGPGYATDFTLIADLGTVDVSSTGIKSISTSLCLPQGVVGVACISNGAPKLMGSSTNLIDLGLSANSYNYNPVSYWYSDSTPSFTALPATTNNVMPVIMNAGAPQMMIKGGVL